MPDLGQLYVTGVTSTGLDDDLRRLIAEGRPGGLILFQRNLREDLEPAEGRRALWRLLADVQTLYRELELPPPFLMIDHEGGRVHRLPGAATRFPPPGRLAGLPLEQVTAVARQQAAELRALGFNTVLGPVLDLCPAAGTSSHIGPRAYGDDPEDVAARASAAIAGFQAGGLLPVPKHFPGYGAGAVDPHFDLPLQPAPLAELERRSLVPFRRVASEGCPALMTAHILAPALDPERPCTLSPAWVRYLREDLGFGGCLVSDDLCMKSVWGRVGPGELAEGAVGAGLDLLLVCHGAGEFEGAYARSREHLEAAVARDPALRAAAEAALARVGAARARLAPVAATPPDDAVFAAGERLREELAAQGATW